MPLVPGFAKMAFLSGLLAASAFAAAPTILSPNRPSPPTSIARNQLLYYQAEYNDPYIGYTLYVTASVTNGTAVWVCESRTNTQPQFNTSDCDKTYALQSENNAITPKYPFTMFGEYYYAVTVRSDDSKPDVPVAITLMYVLYDKQSPIPGGTAGTPLIQGIGFQEGQDVLTNGSAVELSWHAAKDADTYQVVAFPKKCSADMNYNRVDFLKEGLHLYNESTTSSVGSLVREITGLVGSDAYCFNVLASSTKTNQTVAYVALSVYSNKWYGPARANSDQNTIIVVVVCVSFLFLLGVAGVAYWLYRKRKEQDSFELY